jgi:hypothetical protein
MATILRSERWRGLVDQVMSRHLAGVAYKQQLGLYDDWDEYDKFVQADHWPDPTPDTMTLPRPITNFVFADKEFLVAALLQENPIPYFVPREGPTDGSLVQLRQDRSKILSEVAGFTWDVLDMAVLLEDVVDTAFTLGTGIFQFWWDPEKRTGSADRGTVAVGDIAGTEADPYDFFPGNPKTESLQKQPWIILTERKPVDQVRDTYRPHVGSVVDAIKPDGMEIYGETLKWRTQEPMPNELVTLRHMWWKQRGPEGSQRVSYAVVASGRLVRYEDELYPFPLYPFAVFRPYRRRKVFWGMGIVEQEINNQKEWDRLDAMTLLSAYRTANPAVMYKPESGYKPQKRSNLPGEQIPDMSPPGQWGVRFLEPPNYPAYPMQWQMSKRAQMQQIVGVQDAMAGKQLPGHQNASAIAYLQQTGFLRIAKVRERLYRSIRDCVRIWYEMWRNFYVTDRIVRILGPSGEMSWERFRGTDFYDLEFDIRVKAGPGTILSREAMMAQAAELFKAGLLPPDLYVESLPDEIAPYKEQLLERLKSRAQAPQAGPPAGQPAGIPPLGPGGPQMPQQGGGVGIGG